MSLFIVTTCSANSGEKYCELRTAHQCIVLCVLSGPMVIMLVVTIVTFYGLSITKVRHELLSRPT